MIDSRGGELAISALVFSFFIGFAIAAIPGGISLNYLIIDQDDSQLKILGGFFFIASLGLGAFLAWWIFYPLLREVFTTYVEETVLTPEESLQTYFAV